MDKVYLLLALIVICLFAATRGFVAYSRTGNQVRLWAAIGSVAIAVISAVLCLYLPRG
jgi:hypothetical protein